MAAWSHRELDITDARHVRERVQALKPSLIINAAAYTAVDAAEADAERAFAVNETGAANVAEAAKFVGARLVHISTDYVFDGTRSTPYPPDAEPNPLNVYGASKLAGERRVTELLGGQAIIVRAAWLYSRYGRNFVKTMLRLFAERDEISIVADQIGVPTWGKSLAAVAWAAGTAPQLHGVYHWADGGTASWYEFAQAIYADARERNLLNRTVKLRAIRADEYPTAARRPPYSVLDAGRTIERLGVRPEPWRSALRHMLNEMTT